MQTLQPDFVIIIDKPLDWTSFDVVNRLKVHIKKNYPDFKNIKIGHAGTLDPLATGVLVVCFGKATKRIEKMQDTKKEYTGSFILGATTPSYDLETEIDKTFAIDNINEKNIYAVAKKFIGEQLQTPPVFSAKKINGVRAYEHAREGTTVKMRQNLIEIFEFDITKIELPRVDFRIVCSKGTYIRSIAYDFGKKLNNGAYLAKLCRTKSGDAIIENSCSLNEALANIEIQLKKD